MDKEWTKLSRLSRGYKNGVKSFLHFSYTKGTPQGLEISCPCAKCKNGRWYRRKVVFNHLIASGFVEGYDVWVNHGENIPSPMKLDSGTNDQDALLDDISGLLNETFRNAAKENGDIEGPNEDARKFYNLIEEAKQELYPGCKDFSTLSFIIRLYLLKCLHGWSNASFTALLELLKEAIPNLNIPGSFHKAKAMISDLGLDYKKIDVDVEGTSKKRTRGPTQCLKIYARSSKDRQEVIFDDDGEPIGPDDKTVSDLSYFLGTIARSANYCPLIYTNFKLLVKNHKKSILRYLNHKFIIPEKGEKAVLSRINDAWRSYKSSIKKKHFLKYSTTKERLKHRPQTIPEEHFKKLMLFWKVSTVQTISQKNAQNRRKQKYMHRVGPINFARIRARLLAKKKEGEEVSQAEMFIETRKGQKGKAVDEQTQIIVDTLQESIENSSDDAEKTFHSLFGKEKPGRVRCYGRTMTPSIMKKNVEIASIKKQYSNQITAMERKMQTYDAILKLLLKQQNPDLSEEAVNNLMQCAFETDNSEAPDNMGKSSAPHSSTSTNVLLHEKVGNEVVGEEDEDEDEDFEDFED